MSKLSPEGPDPRFAGWRLKLGLLVAILLGLAAMSQLPAATYRDRALTWTSLLPPFVALSSVLLTKRVVPSLCVALLVASLVGRAPLDGLAHGLSEYVWGNVSDPWHLSVTGFVLSVLVTVKIAESSGGTLALVQAARGLLRSARSVRLGTFVLGVLVFFDDYANTMLVGPSMRPLADRYRVSREKLAYIVDSTAAPIAGLAIVSTWLGYEVGLLEENTRELGLRAGGYSLLLQALPLRFYCVFALVMVLLNASIGRDFGPMHAAESRARKTPSAARDGDSVPPLGRYHWLNAALPMVVLLLSVAVGLIYDGGGFSRTSGPAGVFSVSFWRDTLSGAENSEKVLLGSGLLALSIAALTTLSTRALTLGALLLAVRSGLKTGVMPLSILVCAWGLGTACKDVGTGGYLVTQLAGTLPPTFIPVTTFLAAALVALATGTSWGTMAIVIPAALPLAHSMGGMLILLPTIAAVLDGAIFGDHCSPISDTTLLSSTATECEVVAHVWTQLPYAVAAMLCAALAYVLIALGSSIWVVYAGGFSALALTLIFVGRRVPS